MNVKYPTIVKRYMSSLIDALLLSTIFILSLSLIKGNDQITSSIRFFLPIIIFIFFEPLLTSKACTLGQFITKIRVRRNSDLQHISITASYFRYIIKIILGFISFFSIIFTEKCRAIHDLSTGTIVIEL